MIKTTKELGQLVQDFHALKLPGQTPMMHMGTAYLIDDLLRALEASTLKLKEISELPDKWHTEARDYDTTDNAYSAVKVRAYELQAILG